MTTNSKGRILPAVFPTDTSTFDIVVPGELREPTGAAVYALQGTTLNSATDDANVCGGVTDFTTTAACSVGSNNAEGSLTVTAQTHLTSSAFVRLNTAGSEGGPILRSASVIAIPGGIRLTPLESGTAWRFFVVLIFGAECKAFSDDGDGAMAIDETFDVTHTLSGKPNGGIYFGINDFELFDNHNQLSMGFHEDEGSIVQGCLGTLDIDGRSVTDVAGHIMTDRVATVITDPGVEVYGYELTANDATNCTYTNRIAANFLTGLIGLLIYSDDVQFKFEIVDTPTNDAVDWDYTLLPWKPQLAIGVMTQLASINTAITDFTAGTHAYFGFDEDGIEASYGYQSENGFAVSNCQSFPSDRLQLETDEGAATVFQLTNPSFTASGFSFAAGDITSLSGTIRKWPMLFMQKASTGQITRNSKVRTVLSVLPTDIEPFEVKIPGESRRPTGLVAYMTFATALDTITQNKHLAIGVTDFNFHACAHLGAEDARGTPSHAGGEHTHGTTVQMFSTSDPFALLRSFHCGAIAGGVKIYPVQSGVAHRIRLDLIFGMECYAFSTEGDGSVAVAETFDVNHPLSGTPNGGIYFTRSQYLQSSGINNLGVGYHSGIATPPIQMSFVNGEEDADAVQTNTYAQVITDRVGAVLTESTGAIASAYELTSVNATRAQFTGRTGTSTNNAILGLLLFADDINMVVQMATVPTDAGSDWDYTGVGFRPQAVMGNISMMDTVDTASADARSGASSIFCFDKDGGKVSTMHTSEDQITFGLQNTACAMQTDLRCPFDDQNPTVDFDNPFMTDDGFSVLAADIGAFDVVNQRWPIMFFEDPKQVFVAAPTQRNRRSSGRYHNWNM